MKLIWTIISRLTLVTKKALKNLQRTDCGFCVEDIDINISLDTTSQMLCFKSLGKLRKNILEVFMRS